MIAIRSGWLGMMILTTASLLGAAACAEPDLDDGEEGRRESALSGGGCFAGSLGSETSCKPGDVWNEHAAAECSAKGAVLARISYSGDECGKNLYGSTKFECCPAPPAAEPAPSVPAPPPAAPAPPAPPAPTSPAPPADPAPPKTKPLPVCVERAIGDATTCKDQATWKQIALDACASGGQFLWRYSTDFACNKSGGARQLRFTCCK